MTVSVRTFKGSKLTNHQAHYTPPEIKKTSGMLVLASSRSSDGSRVDITLSVDVIRRLAIVAGLQRTTPKGTDADPHTKDYTISRLTQLSRSTDFETAHAGADECIVAFLQKLGYGDIVAAYEKIHKEYA